MMKWGDGRTHWVTYEPHNIGRDLVTAACGERIHITEFSATPTCASCRAFRIRERLKKLRDHSHKEEGLR
jgi:hypothetical protein